MNIVVNQKKINLNFSYLLIAKKIILDEDFGQLKKIFMMEFNKINL